MGGDGIGSMALSEGRRHARDTRSHRNCDLCSALTNRISEVLRKENPNCPPDELRPRYLARVEKAAQRLWEIAIEEKGDDR